MSKERQLLEFSFRTGEFALRPTESRAFRVAAETQLSTRKILVTNYAGKIPLLVFAVFKVISIVFGNPGWDPFTGPIRVNFSSLCKRFL